MTTKTGVKKRREKGWPKSAAGGEGRVLTRMHRSSQREQLKKDLGVVQPKALERDGQKEPKWGSGKKSMKMAGAEKALMSRRWGRAGGTCDEHVSSGKRKLTWAGIAYF